jgi:PKD repeat protein
MKAAFRLASLLVLVASAACTVHGVDVPQMSGPSEFAQSVAVTALPDSILQDGASQSSIAIVVRDANGKGTSGVTVRLQTAVNGSVQDYGTLSAKTVVTGTDGRATAVYTAPPPPASLGGSGNLVAILATPIGSNYQTSVTQSAEVRLVPPGVVLPAASAPTADFVVSPTPVSASVSVNFDASKSCATQTACTSTAGLTSFQWNFGDGSSGVGQTTAHTFSSAGTYSVTLTVTNDRGLSASKTTSVSVSTTANPSAVIDVSTGATPVTTASVINLTAERSTAATGRTLTQFNWNLGTADTNVVSGQAFPSGLRQSVQYKTPGVYTIILSVLDDAGQKGTATVTITVQ